MWKETAVGCINALSRNLPGDTEKNHEKLKPSALLAEIKIWDFVIVMQKYQSPYCESSVTLNQLLRP
jgi:hypothetical protein